MSPATVAELSAQLELANARIAELEARQADNLRAERVQAALYRIAEVASAVQDMPAFYAEVHRIVGELIDARNFFITLFDAARNTINFPYYVDQVDLDVPSPNHWDPIGEGEARGMTAFVLRTAQPQHLPRSRMQRLIDQGEIDLLGVLAVDWLGAPLKTGDRLVGLLVVQSYTEGVTYTDGDLSLLAYVAQYIAAALERARLLAETRQRNAELAIINSVGEAMAKTLDVKTVTRIVGDKVRDIFKAEVTEILLLDIATGLIQVPYSYALDYQAIEPFALGQGLTSRVLRSRQPLNLGIFKQQLDMGGLPSYASRQDRIVYGGADHCRRHGHGGRECSELPAPGLQCE